LYLTHRVPFPPDKGDRIRNYHLLRQLATRARVWLLALADEPVPAETTAELNRLSERVEVVPLGGVGRYVRMAVAAAFGHSLSEGAHWSRPAEAVVRRWAAEAGFAAAAVSMGGLANYLRVPELAGVRRFVDLVDVDSQKWFDFAEAERGPKRWLYRFEGKRLRTQESGLPKWSAAVSIVAEHEAKLFEGFAGTGTATVATNGVDLDYYRPTPDATEQKACAFVGALDYLPNVDAAVWFATEVWPRVRERHPDAEFRVIGRKPAPAVRRLGERPGVTVVGQVPDVRPFVASAAVSVNPMRLSRGLQNKVLEALAMGKAVVAAPPALAALRAVPGEHLLAAESPAEWADAVCRLFDDPGRRAALGAAGRRFVEQNHHWDRCLRPLLDKMLPG
jgi:sugar transferase (PEP-CTERM/EpsH1 system associated)